MNNITSKGAQEVKLSKEELIDRLTKKAQPNQAPICVPVCGS